MQLRFEDRIALQNNARTTHDQALWPLEDSDDLSRPVSTLVTLMNIVLDNIIFSLQQAGGISAYWYELTRRLARDRSVTFYEMPNRNIFRQQLTGTFTKESRLPVNLVRYLPFMRRPSEEFLFHSSYYRVALNKSATNISTVHDFTYEHEYLSSGLPKFIHARQKRFAIERSSGVICVSENTRRDLLNFFPAFPEERTRVVYNGVGEEFYPIAQASESLHFSYDKLNLGHYVLFVGARGAYKNFSLAVEAISDSEDLSLVAVGGGEICSHERTSLKPLDGRFFHFSSIHNSELNQLYNRALCLLYPSEYEGFGIPVVEAMRAGCPVVACKTSSLPEVAGDAALLVEEATRETLADSIRQLRDPTFRANLVNKGYKQASRFSWDRCFNETLEFYRHIWHNLR